MTYYRFSNNDTAMSDYGHAMFAADRDSVCDAYGVNEFTYDGTDAVTIESLSDIIINKWNMSLDNGTVPVGYEDVDAGTLVAALNPEDIVMGAEAWDCKEICMWFGDNIAWNYEIKAVITNDGAIVFDESLINKETNY